MVAITLQPGRRPHEEPQTLIFRNSPGGKLDLSGQVAFGTHRGGWQYALEQLKTLHNTEGTLFDGFIEQRFGWWLDESVKRGRLPYLKPWVGFLHNPPGQPGFYRYRTSPAGLLENCYFQESLENCAGIFVLSDYLARWLSDRIDVPVVSVCHPTNLDVPGFSPRAFFESRPRRVVQIGFWLRKFRSLRHLEVEGYEKLCVIPHSYAEEYVRLEYEYACPYNASGEEVVGSYRWVEWMPPRDYDQLLSTSIVFLDLYDASANNAILECIARNTPVLVNPLPAVVEHLGADYPFYFDSLEEAANKVHSERLILDAHEYLANMDKARFAPGRFRSAVLESRIYQGLPPPTGGQILPAEIKPPIDKLGDLRIVHGRPLSNRYVFAVCFRNVGEKLVRCIESICRQKKYYDFGVVLMDDASGDSMVVEALACLERHGIPCVAVVNDERKYFTRNLYNAVNLLVDNDETVVVEVDGDDYLEEGDVLGILEEAYELGAIKTFGSFRCVPQGTRAADEVESYRLVPTKNDITRPWDLDACVSWMHLKTYKKSLFMKVPLVYFWERNGGGWLKMAEDLVVHPKMVEIARYRTAYIEDVLYVYDTSGEQHDMNDSRQAEYILDKLYKVPCGTFIHACRQRLKGRAAAAGQAAPKALPSLRGKAAG